jgi:peptidoglycan/LPS O-acetylase OafA/YrhL
MTKVPDPEAPKRSRLMFVDILKIIAIAMVLIQHESTAIHFHSLDWINFTVGPGLWRLNWGNIGVSLFLFASGLGLAYGYTQIKSWGDLKNFYSKRILRIYPSYWIGGILFALLLTPSWLLKPHAPLDMVKLAAGFQSLGGHTSAEVFGSLNSSLWFMTLILLMYLAFPAIYYFVAKHPHVSFIGLLAISLTSRYYLSTTSVPFLSSLWFPPCRIFEFGLGIYIAKIGLFPKIASNKITAYLGSLSFFIFLINIPLLEQFGGQQWLFLSLLFVISAALLQFDGFIRTEITHVGNIIARAKTPQMKRLPRVRNPIGHLYFGLFGGVAGVIAAGVLMRVLALSLQDIWVPALVACGVLGGLGFGLLTNGNQRLRATIGCFFGLIAIIFGLIMTYSAPIVVSYKSTLTSAVSVPIYKWQQYTFIQFAGHELGTLHAPFIVFFGLLSAAFFGGLRFPVKTRFATLVPKLLRLPPQVRQRATESSQTITNENSAETSQSVNR